MIKQAEQLRDGVHQAYSAAAEYPQSEHPFPMGRQFAESLGYKPAIFMLTIASPKLNVC